MKTTTTTIEGIKFSISYPNEYKGISRTTAVNQLKGLIEERGSAKEVLDCFGNDLVIIKFPNYTKITSNTLKQST